MNIIKFVTLIIITLLVFTASSVVAQTTSKIYFFYGTGCPHCAVVEKFFADENLLSRYPVEKKEIYFNRDNTILFNSLMDELNAGPFSYLHFI